MFVAGVLPFRAIDWIKQNLDQLSDRSAALTSLWSGPARTYGTSPGRFLQKGYLPSFSIFFFSSSFISLIFGSWLDAPVV
jgi:hypothetical protein